MVTRSIQFPDNMYNKLSQIAELKVISISAIVKLACDEYINKSETEQEISETTHRPKSVVSPIATLDDCTSCVKSHYNT